MRRREPRSLRLFPSPGRPPAHHVVRDCSHRLDVRQLTTEQREELIEDLLALKDAVPIEESCPPEEEDFV